MKSSCFAALIFGLLLLSYFIFLACTVSLLPQQMATHFDASGHPNGWMSRSSAVAFQGVIGVIPPLIISTGFFVVRFAPPEQIRVPGRDFWFAPERRAETCAYLSRQGFWLASMLVLLQALVWYQLIEANAKSIPQLSSLEFLVVLGIFGAAIIVWVLSLFHHFARAA